MSNTAPAQAVGEDEHLGCVRSCLSVFTIMFDEIYEGGPKRFIARALYTQATAFMRGLEALLRRVLLVRAAKLVPGLPPVKKTTKPRPAATRTPPPAFDPADTKTWRVSFCGLKHPHWAKGRKPGPRKPKPGPAQPPSALVPLKPIALRMHALLSAIDDIDGRALRLAHRLRPYADRGETLAIIDSPRLHPDHARYLARHLDVFREDANDALRAMVPDTS